MEQLAVGGAREAARAPVQRGAAVGARDHVQQHVRALARSPRAARPRAVAGEQAHALDRLAGAQRLACGQQRPQQGRAAATPRLDRAHALHARSVAPRRPHARAPRPCATAHRAATTAQHPRPATCYGRGVWPVRKPAKAVQALAGRSSKQHPPRSSTHIPVEEHKYAHWHREVVQRRQGVRFHHP